MSNASDFVIKNGILKEYVGPGGAVTIPDDVHEIGYSSFSHNDTITSVTIPNGVTVIGAFAFEYCKNVTEITIPETIQQIKECAFRGCDGLTDAQGMLIINHTLYYAAPWVTDIVVPAGVVRVENRAFEECRKLTTVVLPPDVKDIGKCFCNRDQLTAIKLSENIGSISEKAFAGCEKLKSITIPEHVEEIGRYAFEGCRALEHIVLPTQLKKIGVGAFLNCHELSEILLPDTVESIGEHAFECVQNEFSEICRENGSFQHSLYQNGLHRMQVSEQTIEKLGKTYARSVLIQPEMMLAYLRDEFEPCNTSLQKMVVSAINLKKNREYCLEQLLQKDDAKAMDKLFKVLKGVSVDDIDAMIKQCVNDQKPQLNSFLLQYKERAFSRAQIAAAEEDKVNRDLGLREKTLAEWRKEYVVKIENQAVFLNKYKGSDETVVVPAHVGGHCVVELGEKAFTHCETVRTVIIPEGVKCIGWRCFWGCPNVKDIHIPASVDCIGTAAIQGKKKCIHAPAGSYAEVYAKESGIPFVAEG